MKTPHLLQRIVIPVLALLIGLISGLVYSHVQIKKEQDVCQNRIRESDRKIAYIQKKGVEEKSQATASLEQQFQDDLKQISDLKREKKNLAGQAGRLKEQAQNLEFRLKGADEAFARVKKLENKLRDADEASARTKKELQETAHKSKGLEQELKKMAAEKQAFETALTKTTRTLGSCRANNAKLCTLAEELINKYKNKGFLSVLAEKEPLTQINKVELEQLTQKYQEEIRQQKINKKKCEGEKCY